ncbi:hypothetical protein ACTUVK_003051 [Stenotrophomonas rhizophila]|jgi:hypothetical protein|uniref:Transmembrane protein n=1 Tax=Stenotrophomonas nematodicola TaxID=2656746 RepID=A0ABW7CYB5_9GAMM|nr:hypothetical protein [Stenotrophomonas sp. BIGb0135]MCS4236123.1 hypothetical protein [Stenotrophomonas sp. BIGb0135]
MNLELLMAVLGTVAMRLPILIALAVSVVWVADSPRGAVRSVALWALGLLALTTLAGLLVNIVPQWLVQQGDYASMQGMVMWLGGARFVLGLVDALAIVLLVWAMTRALRGRAPAPAG